MPPASKRQFAEHYANALILSDKAHSLGLDQTASFEKLMRLVRMDMLSQQLLKAIQQKAAQISDQDVEQYYHANLAVFEQADLERIFIPKTKQVSSADAKLSPEERKKRQDAAEADMKQEAEALHTRAAGGEDFSALQAEAFRFAEFTNTASNTTLNVRRSALPQGQAAVFSLTPGTVSGVIPDPTGGYDIYKMVKKETLPLERVKNEIKNTVQSQRTKESMDTIKGAATTVLDGEYFKVPEGSLQGRQHPHMAPKPGGPAPGQPAPDVPAPQ
jgi:hypothetical protein